MTLYLKISWENGKPYCIKVWDYFSDIIESDCKSGKYVNNCYVPRICGVEPGRVETDPDCKPKLKHTPLSEEPLPPSSSQEELLDRDFDGIRNSQDACPDEYAKTENGCPDVSTGTTQEQKSGATPEQKPDNPWQIVGIVIFALIALYLVYKIRKKAAEKVQSQYKNLAIVIGGIIGIIAGALVGSGFGAGIGLAMLKGAGIGAVAGTAIGYGVGSVLPSFQGLPPGTGANIRGGAAIAHAGETIVRTESINMNETNRLLTELIRGNTKIARNIEELG